MPSLTETAHYTRKILKFGTLALVALIVLRLLFNFSQRLYRQVRPPAPPAPTVAFGQLPAIVFPESQALDQKPTFKLETIEGGLPQLPTLAKVFFMPQSRPNLLALDRAKELARKMGFTAQPEAIDATHYRWTTLAEAKTTLVMDINLGNFELRYEYENDPEILARKNLPANEQAAQEAKSFLNSNDLLPDDLAAGTAEFDYLRITPPSVTAVASLSEADLVRVNLFRADLDNLKIMPPDPKKSLVSFLFSGARTTGKRIVAVDYLYFPIETATFATYPLRPVTQAFSELQAGQAFVAHLGQNESDTIILRHVFLAYFDGSNPQNYLQPVYVFAGDNDFFAYVSALDPQWLE